MFINMVQSSISAKSSNGEATVRLCVQVPAELSVIISYLVTSWLFIVFNK